MLTLEPNRTALLVMDLQDGILERLGDRASALLDINATVIAAARKAKLPIIYVVVGFRPGYPELNTRNASFVALAKTGQLITTTPGSDIAAKVKPEDGDVVVMKHRVGAFAGTDMDMILRAKGIETIVLTGIATSGVILSTVRYAADADYRIVVVKDCCMDADEEVHRVLTEKVFIRQATVTTASEVIAAFDR